MSLDLTAELSQLVRDHCVVLSLSRKLFHLQDPRQDLSSVLECLAVLSRLVGRLGFFDLSIRTSDSSESLPSHTGAESRKNSEPSRQHENLRASLSVFASMEQIARHLQDYDGFLGRMMQSHLGRDASVIESIETLTGAIEEQLAVVEQLRGLLGSTTAVKELPSLVEFLQRLVAESTVDEEERGDDQDSCSLSVATMLKTVEEAFQDRVSLRGLLVQLRETLPFSSSVETPEELMEQLRETLLQCDTLIQDKENAWKMVEQLTEQLGQIDKRLADESHVLNGLGDEDIADLPHVERLARLVEQLKILRRANGMMTASIAAETELLRDVRLQADASSCSELIQLDARVEAVHALLEARATLTQEKEALECELQKTRSDFETKLRDAESDYEAKLHVATSNFEMAVHQTMSDFETKLHDTESDYKTKLQDATNDFEARLQQTKSDFEAKLRDTETELETKLRDTTSDFETKLHDATSEGETKLRDAESAFEAHLRDTETAYETKLHDMETTYETKLRDMETTYETKLRDVEITYETKLRDTETVCETRLLDTESAYEIKAHDTETTYETKLSDAETAYATKLRDTETAYETKLRDTETTYETKLSDAETAYATKLRDMETAYETKLRDAEDTYETKTRDAATAFATELSETETQWKARHEDATSQLAAEREKLEDAIREETRFLRDRGIEWGEHESRFSIYDRLITKCDGYSIQEQRVRDQVLEEAAFLESHGMEMVTAGDQETHSSRMVLFRTLLEGQRVLIDEKMEREITDQQERARLEAEGIAVSDRGAIITRVIDLTKQVRQLEHDNAAQRKQRDQVCAMECAFLEAHGFPDVDLSPSDTRIPLFESLLERLEAAQQALIAWEGSPHEDALGCRQADTMHEADRQRLEQDYADATSKAIVAALDKQAKQLSFRSAALAAGDAALPLLTMAPSNSTTQALIEAVTKRDNAAVTMIYRLIRLTTDVLNTSAFSSSGGSGGGGEIPVDLTQCVMTCVKELKALKEYLLHTLEKITQDSRAFAIAQPRLAITREAVTQRDAAIDFAWLLHRAFVADVHSTLAKKCAIVTSTIHSLSESLATHAGDFGEAEHKYMAMEMQLAEDVAEKAAIEAKYATQEAFVERFVDERKQVEVALTKALEEATQDRTELLAKIEMLEAEKSEAFALVYANGINTTGSHSASSSTLRTPLSSSHGRTVSHAGVVPTRPTKPRELTSSRLKIGMPSTSTAAGAVHKERFVSNLERETGQRRTTAAASNPHAGMTARRANEWKRHELLTSSMQIEEQFRAMTASSTDYLSLSSSESPRERSTAAGDQEVWYQGVRMLQHVSFFVSVFFVPKQKTFRVEVFNSDSEQQQTIYVTLEEMQSFLRENKHATKNGLTLEDPARHGEVVDVLFERVKVLGGGVGGDSSNLLFAFQ